MKASRKFIRLSLVVGWLVVMAIAFAPQAAYAVTCTSNGTGGGNWYTGSTWQTDCGTYGPVTNDVVIIQSGDTVTLNGDLTGHTNMSITVNTGGILQTSATRNLNGNTIAVNGTFRLQEGGFVSNGTLNYGSGGILEFANTSGNFGLANDHVFWPTTNGPANVTVSGSGGLDMNTTRTIAGTLLMSAQVVDGNQLTVNGTVQINSGGYFSNSGPNYGSSSTLKYNSSGTYGRGLEWSATSGAGYPANVQIGNNTTLNLGSGARSMGGNLTIGSGSTLNQSTVTDGQHLTVGGSVDVQGTLTLSTAKSDLFLGGNWTRGASGTFTPNGSIVEFNSTTAAQTINGATTFDRLTINNSNGVSLNAAQVVNTNLNLSNGRLTLGAYDLTMGSSAEAIAGTHSATRMIVADSTGALCKRYSANGSYDFPIGDVTGTADYSPATLSFGSGSYSAEAQACVRVTDAKHPKNLSANHYITRYWTVTQSNITSFSCATTFNYVNSTDDIAGTEANIKTGKWGTVWTVGAAANTTNHTVGDTFTSFSDITGGEAGTLAVDLAAFTADATPTGVTLAWETVSETDNAGFNVYRAEGGSVGDRPQQEGTWVRLNAALIPAAAPGSSEGHAYTWTDATARPNTPYRYRLEAVALDGTMQVVDVIDVTDRPLQRHWLPLLARAR